jgi:hypothetical protein
MITTARRLSALAAVIAAGASAASIASASAPLPNPIVIRATAVPTFLGPTPSCPVFRAHERATDPDGRTIGSYEFCFASFVGDPSTGDVGTGVAGFDLVGGMIETTLTLTETPIANGVLQTVTGRITLATGTYAGATGSVSGGGSIVFDASGTPHPDLTLTITLA